MVGGRRAAAAIVVLALALVPLAADWCIVACERGAVPHCHHPAPAAGHVGHAPVTCGHDHALTPGTNVDSRGNTSIALNVAPAAGMDAAAARIVDTRGRASPADARTTGSASFLSSPLRI